MEKHDQLLMKRQNKNLVLDILKTKSPISRIDIAKMTGMSPTSITRIVTELQLQGYLRETEAVASGVGRKATLLEVRGDVLYTVGIEIDKSLLKVGIVNYIGEMVSLHKSKRNESESYMETLHKIDAVIRKIMDENEIPAAKIMGLAVGLPGYIDYKNGIVKISDQLKWKDASLAEDLQKLTSFNVIVDNELKMKIVAESFTGKAKNSQNSILIGIGSGIGSSIMLNGDIYRGETNNAGEIGHTVIDPTGNVCNCGKIGCLATYISEGAILADSRKVKDISSIEDVFQSYRDREPWALNIMDRASTYIALAISNLLCLYNPEVIILSGNTIEKLPEMKQAIEQKCELYIWEPLKQSVRIVYSELSENGVVLGAAIQAQNLMLELE
ncbi:MULTISPECIES: ROK family transcriptional regulator [Cytobacillus]|uniref:ROK family protein n=1 Tax=Cytobacillus oceanisediminis TaxID=665099 RepID=A0ABX3D0T3_9BACI|nr:MULTISPECIES: ROK family transcriptional regulator [Cytobacillus]MBY0155502.1 ROK family protein [Cytobacillus firmus]MBU8769625.1 ROK family protein [Cytobacillus oceanisediminis]MCM3530287.1 ROK family protein [Cytobacillus oceanisediminis]MCS0823992.1 ROK family protein [Cytobacillus firmus]OHX50758.1 ROK family protein [Cytobacillus oceanisediminis]